MDAHAQISIVFVTSLILIITASIQFFKTEYKPSKVFSIITIILTGCLFLFIFVLGGAISIPLEPYMRKSLPGVTHLPPVSSWLTWVRLALVLLGFMLSYLELKGGAKDVNDANNT